MKYMITMPNGDIYQIPLVVIAKHRANNYKQDVSFVMEYFKDYPYEAEDWARGNMNWSDVAYYAKLESRGEVDFQEGWCNGKAEITD